MDDRIFKLALNNITGIGPVKARAIVSYVGSVEGVFSEKKENLQKIPGIGPLLSNFKKTKIIDRAKEELDFIEKNKISLHFYLDSNYPKSLSQFEDSPILLFVKGNIDFSKKKFISIVGTRTMTHYGESLCNKLITDIATKGYSPVIVSGLAYGVDYCAHKAALKNNLETLAILAHGLDIIYPSSHRELAKSIIKKGALVSEFMHKTKIDPSNFVRRNRIIAALSEATVVVESPKKGGSLITAEYAIGYSKDVYTFPGRVGDQTSEGCNFLIKTNRAALIENADDIISNLQWENRNKNVQNSIFVELDEDEQKIADILKLHEMLNVDVISYETKLPINKILAVLFNMEFKNIVKALPGRMYKLQ